MSQHEWAGSEQRGFLISISGNLQDAGAIFDTKGVSTDSLYRKFTLAQAFSSTFLTI
jgi:hypothetical protein